MPELPEVETIKNDLRALVLGRRIVRARVLDEALIVHPAVATFVARLADQEMVAVDRRAKFLLIELSAGDFLVLQLMITGQFLLLPAATAPRKSTRLILALDDGRELHLVDANYYARVHLLAPAELNEKLHLDELGPEAIAPDLTPARFAGLFAGRRGQLKPLLLNQRFISGLGNIYVDEALFAARLHPARDARTLSAAEKDRLYENVRRVLAESIARRGTTIWTYRDVLGRKGHYQECLQVFGREGKPCAGCGAAVAKTTLGGRQTFFCPSCQPPVPEPGH